MNHESRDIIKSLEALQANGHSLEEIKLVLDRRVKEESGAISIENILDGEGRVESRYTTRGEKDGN